MAIKWELKSWEELTTNELYDLLALRAEVFVVEQNCPYQDCDGKDRKSMHLWGIDNDEIIACLRICMPGVSYAEMSIGRVVVKEEHRGKALGKVIMKKAVEWTQQKGEKAVRISAQCYLRKFYKTLGFEEVSEEYLEDGIPHVEMLLKN